MVVGSSGSAGPPRVLPEPGLEQGPGGGNQGRAPLLAALAQRVHVGPGSERYFLAGRDTNATLAAASGAPLPALIARLGHASAAAAIRYQHKIEGQDEAVAASRRT